jgi:hypothetical protein
MGMGSWCEGRTLANIIPSSLQAYIRENVVRAKKWLGASRTSSPFCLRRPDRRECRAGYGVPRCAWQFREAAFLRKTAGIEAHPAEPSGRG